MGRLSPYLMLTISVLVLIGIVVIYTWLVVPGWRTVPGGMGAIFAEAAPGVLALVTTLFGIFKGLKEILAKPGKPAPTASLQITGNVEQKGETNVVATTVTAERIGGTHIDRVEHLTIQTAPAGPDRIPKPGSTIQPPPQNFTGREEEAESLVAALQAKGAGSSPGTAGRPAALIGGVTGGAGVGKTALARAAANRLRDEYPYTVEIDLKGAARPPETPLDPAAAARNILFTFFPDQPPPTDPTDVFTLYRRTLSEHKTLLLLDNARDANQVRPLLPPPPSAALITSRSRFRLPEVGLKPLLLDVLSPEQACALLHKLSSRLMEADGKLVLAIAERCGYLPLALQVAAALLESRDDWSPQDLLHRLDDQRTRLQTLRLPDDTSLDVYAALEASYQSLPEALHQRYRYLGVFPASFDRNALAYVWSGERELTPALDADLGRLLKSSLVEYNRDNEQYMLHDLTRLHAYTHLLAEQEGSGEAGEALRRHADYYLDLAEDADDAFLAGGEHIAEALSAFRQAWPHLEEAFQRLAATPPVAEVPEAERWLAAFPLHLPILFDLHLPPGSRIPILERAFEAARRTGDRWGEGAALGNLGNAYYSLGEARRAIEFYEQALVLTRELGDRQGEGVVLDGLGNAYYSLGETHRSIEFHGKSLQIHQETGDRRREGNALGNLGVVYRDLGETHRAIECHEQALRIFREIGDRRGEGNTLNNLGIAYRNIGETHRAIEFFEQALPIAQETGDRWGEGNVLTNLGLAYHDLSETHRAIECHEQALRICREIGDRRGEGNALNNLGIAYYDLGETHREIEFLEQALVIARETGDRRREGNALANLGTVYKDLGETHRVIRLYEQALAIFREIGDRQREGVALMNLGLAYTSQNEIHRVIEFFEQALRIFEEIESPYAAMVREQLDELDRGSGAEGEAGETE